MMKQFEWKPFAFAFTVNERWNKRDARHSSVITVDGQEHSSS